MASPVVVFGGAGAGVLSEILLCLFLSTHPIPVIMSETKVLIEQYGVTLLRILDECFGTDKEWLYAFCNAIIANFPQVIWCGEMKTREDYALDAQGGLLLRLYRR